MTYVRVINGQAVEYTLGQLRRDNPNTSFPSQPSLEILAQYNMYPLEYAEQPDTTYVSLGPIELIDGVWTQTFIGSEPTIESLRENMVVTARQARLALLDASLLSQVDVAIQAMPEPDKTQVSIEWEYATEIERTSPWVIAMGQALNLSETELDALFEVAKGY